MAKDRKTGKPGDVEGAVVQLAEQLGWFLGRVQAKADGWLDNPIVQEKVSEIRDGATDLFERVSKAGAASRATATSAAAAAKSASTAARATGKTAANTASSAARGADSAARSAANTARATANKAATRAAANVKKAVAAAKNAAR